MKRRRRRPKRRNPFASQAQNSKTYPEPGAWVEDTSSGMPEVGEPQKIPYKRLLTACEIRDDFIAYDGLGFCVYTAIPAEKIADKELRRLWQEARAALQQIVEYLE